MTILLIEPDPGQVPPVEASLQSLAPALMVAYDGQIGWKLLASTGYDLLILTPELAGIDGFELIRSLRAQGSQIPVLLLGTPDRPDPTPEATAAMRFGATAFLPRPCALEQLRACAQRLIGTQSDCSSDWLQAADLQFNLRQQIAYRQNRPIGLSARESRLLWLLMQHQGSPVTKAQLINDVWDGQAQPNTVEVYINALRKKIDGKSAQRLIHTVLGRGYMLQPLPPPG